MQENQWGDNVTQAWYLANKLSRNHSHLMCLITWLNTTFPEEAIVRGCPNKMELTCFWSTRVDTASWHPTPTPVFPPLPACINISFTPHETEVFVTWNLSMQAHMPGSFLYPGVQSKSFDIACPTTPWHANLGGVPWIAFDLWGLWRKERSLAFI